MDYVLPHSKDLYGPDFSWRNLMRPEGKGGEAVRRIPHPPHRFGAWDNMGSDHKCNA